MCGSAAVKVSLVNFCLPGEFNCERHTSGSGGRGHNRGEQQPYGCDERDSDTADKRHDNPREREKLRQFGINADVGGDVGRAR